MTANAALDSLLAGLTAALRAQIRPGTGLYDPLDDKASPPDHYGHLCAALALACGSADDWQVGREALQAWLALDPKRLGHLPFNRLALLLLRIVLAERGLDATDEATIAAGLARCRLRRRYPSNNWSLLAQTCRLIEAPARRKARESRRLCELLERWTTAKGGFIDFPAKPGKRFATPLAYHHKALYLAALACWFHDDAELARHARRLLDWLVHCWDPAGYAGGFGRTTHGLFGDGCLIAGMMLMGIDDDERQTPIAALCHRLQAQRRTDGLLWLNPAGHESGLASWDSYMHLSVYNAWAAGMIAAARHLRRTRTMPRLLDGTEWLAFAHGWFHDEEAGLGCWRTPSGLTAVVSTRGQPPQSYSRDEGDFRYAGGIIIHLCHPSTGPLLPPPVRVRRTDLLQHPELAGWTPLFEIEGELHALTDFEPVSTSAQEDALRIELAGRPLPVFRPRPRSVWQKVASAIDWRLGGRLGRTMVLRRTPAPSLKARMVLDLTTTANPLESAIHIVLDLDAAPGSNATYLNPESVCWTGPVSSDANQITLLSSVSGARARSQLPTRIPPGFSRWKRMGVRSGHTRPK